MSSGKTGISFLAVPAEAKTLRLLLHAHPDAHGLLPDKPNAGKAEGEGAGFVGQ
jgi:hypothetical protein